MELRTERNMYSAVIVPNTQDSVVKGEKHTFCVVSFFFYELENPLNHVSDEKGLGETRPAPQWLRTTEERGAIRKARRSEVLKKQQASSAVKRH